MSGDEDHGVITSGRDPLLVHITSQARGDGMIPVELGCRKILEMLNAIALQDNVNTRIRHSKFSEINNNVCPMPSFRPFILHFLFRSEESKRPL